jgi:hypothetical protein
MQTLPENLLIQIGYFSESSRFCTPSSAVINNSQILGG